MVTRMNSPGERRNMKDHQEFSTVLIVDKTPKEVFDAVNNVRGWWGDVVGGTHKLNDEFTYRYEDIHYSKQKLIEVIPGRKVVWLVTDSYLNFIKDKSEWTGTKISFEISKEGDKTKLVFTHFGVDPSVECYDVCSKAWRFYVNRSLLNLITKGRGQPN